MDVVQVNPISGLSRVEPPEEQLSLRKMQLYVSIVTVQALMPAGAHGCQLCILHGKPFLNMLVTLKLTIVT